MTATERLAAMRARCEAATPGPWRCDERVGATAVYTGEFRSCFMDWSQDDFIAYRDRVRDGDGRWPDASQTEADFAFIAHARADMPALLAVVEAAVAWGNSTTPRDDMATESALIAAIDAFMATSDAATDAPRIGNTHTAEMLDHE